LRATFASSAARRTIAAILACSALGPVVSCGGASSPPAVLNTSAIGATQTSKFKSALECELGTELADQIANAWSPAFVALAESRVTAKEYQRAIENARGQALLDLVQEPGTSTAVGDPYSEAVDRTMRLLSADPTWRRKLFTAAALKIEFDASPVPGGALRECFRTFCGEGCWQMHEFLRRALSGSGTEDLPALYRELKGH